MYSQECNRDCLLWIVIACGLGRVLRWDLLRDSGHAGRGQGPRKMIIGAARAIANGRRRVYS